MPIQQDDPEYSDSPTLAEQIGDAPLKNLDAHLHQADVGHLLESVPAFLCQYNLTGGPVAVPQIAVGNRYPSPPGGPYVQNTGINPQVHSTLASIVMPPEAKAASILRASPRAGTGTIPAGESSPSRRTGRLRLRGRLRSPRTGTSFCSGPTRGRTSTCSWCASGRSTSCSRCRSSRVRASARCPRVLGRTCSRARPFSPARRSARRRSSSLRRRLRRPARCSSIGEGEHPVCCR